MSTPTSLSVNQRGVVHLLTLLAIGLLLGAALGLFLISKGVIKNPAPNILRISQPAQVELKADYKNPLNKASQYVNPFSEYKNPFDLLK